MGDVDKYREALIKARPEQVAEVIANLMVTAKINLEIHADLIAIIRKMKQDRNDESDKSKLGKLEKLSSLGSNAFSIVRSLLNLDN